MTLLTAVVIVVALMFLGTLRHDHNQPKPPFL